MNRILAALGAALFAMLIEGYGDVIRPASAAVLGEQRVIVLNVCFSDYCPQTWTPQQSQDMVNVTVNAYYDEVASPDNSLLNPPFFSAVSNPTNPPSTAVWWVLPMARADCATGILTLALQAALDHGIDATTYPYIILSYPIRNDVCPSDLAPSGTYGKRTGLPYAVAWLNNPDSYQWTHELGHNMRNTHSHGMNCGTIPLASDISTCRYLTFPEDGDWWADIMGNGPSGHFNAASKVAMGWLAPQVVTVSGTYTLRPVELFPDALRIARAPGQWLVIERRQALGYDSQLNTFTNNYKTGVVVTLDAEIRIGDDGNPMVDPAELDFIPGDNQWANGALQVGQSWTDPLSGVTLQTISSILGGNATVSVTIPGQPPVNQPPVANNDTASTPINTSVLINVRANDTDPDGDPLTVTAVTQPSNGTAVIESNNVRYTPAANFTGVNTFGYTISDGQGHTASATVTVTVTAPVNNPPIANADNAAAAQGQSILIPVLANDSDPDGDPLTIVSVTQPSKGSVSIMGSQVQFVAPNPWRGNGHTSFIYTISDGRGGMASATVMVSRI